MAMQWDPRLAVGVPIIDQQHQELIEALNRLLAAMAASKGAQEVRSLLDFLGDYVVTHFAAEEQLMARHRYPGAAEHREEHAAFVAEFKALHADFVRAGPTTGLVIKLNGRVCQWLREHIAGSDKKLATFVNRVPQAQAAR
jgi:hemerythrin